uniref:Uncharacterized protein n=1 Tax=Anguilla anguilla TaxID=7936 RepID=A0A0E9PB74_ANGAN
MYQLSNYITKFVDRQGKVLDQPLPKPTRRKVLQ